MSLSGADIHITPLELRPESIAQVAVWHHQECQRQGLKSSFALRQQRLQLHLQKQAVPKTWVVFYRGEPAGCVSLVNYRYRTDKNTGAHLSPVWLSNLFVREDLRNCGMGTQLINAVVAYARLLGHCELWLSADEYTGFYQKRSWEIVRLTRLGGRQINIMKRKLEDGSNGLLPVDNLYFSK